MGVLAPWRNILTDRLKWFNFGAKIEKDRLALSAETTIYSKKIYNS